MKNRLNANAILLTILTLGIFFSCCLLGVFGSFGSSISDYMVGFFGYTAYAVVFCTVIVCVILLFGGQVFVRPNSIFKYVLLLALLVLALHTATSKPYFNQSYFAYLKDCFDSASTAGGMLFGIIAYLPVALFSYAGGLAVCCLAFLICSFFALSRKKNTASNFRSKKIIYGSKSTATLTEFSSENNNDTVEEVSNSLYVENISGRKDSGFFRSKSDTTTVHYEPLSSIFEDNLSGAGILDDSTKDKDGDEILREPVLEADVRQQAYDKLFNFQTTYNPTAKDEDNQQSSSASERLFGKYVPRAIQNETAERTTSYYPEINKPEQVIEEPIQEKDNTNEVEEVKNEENPIPQMKLTFESNPYAFTNAYFNRGQNNDSQQDRIFNDYTVDLPKSDENDDYNDKLSRLLNSLHSEPQEEYEESESLNEFESITEDIPNDSETKEDFSDFEEDAYDLLSETVKEEEPAKTAHEILFDNPPNPFASAEDKDEEEEVVVPENIVEETKEDKQEIAPIKTAPAPNRDFSAIEKGNFNSSSVQKSKTDKSKVLDGQIALTEDSVVVKRKPYVAPPLSLLTPDAIPSNVSIETHEETKANLEQVLMNFKVEGQVTGVVTGPAFTRYEINLKPGVSVKNILRISDDIAMGLGGVKIRIEAPVPGKTCVGIEVPNKQRGTVGLRGILEKSDFFTAKSPLTVCLGRNISGDNITCDLADTPHLLVAGATGSGKSVCLNVILCSLLYKSSPEDLRLILVDPKRVELNSYNGLPHMLIKEAITEAPKVIRALDWLIAEMDNRYTLFSNSGVNSIKDYNAKVLVSGEGKKLPYIVIVIDEIGDLMLVAKNDIEDRIQRLAQLARAAGIHIIVATQRPSTDVITGVIKANLPSRIAFAVSSAPDSMTILSLGGAEKLLGKGDMLFSSRTAPDPVRIQCAFIPTPEVQAITQFVKEKNDAFFDENIEKAITTVPASSNNSLSGAGRDDDVDVLFYDILKFAISSGSISVTMVQRKFKLGFQRAARVVDQMYELNYVSKQEGSKPREVLITQEQFNELYGNNEVPDEID